MLNLVLDTLHAPACVTDAGARSTEAVIHAVQMDKLLLSLTFCIVAGSIRWNLKTLKRVVHCDFSQWGDELFERVDGRVAKVC